MQRRPTEVAGDARLCRDGVLLGRFLSQFLWKFLFSLLFFVSVLKTFYSFLFHIYSLHPKINTHIASQVAKLFKVQPNI